MSEPPPNDCASRPPGSTNASTNRLASSDLRRGSASPTSWTADVRRPQAHSRRGRRRRGRRSTMTSSRSPAGLPAPAPPPLHAPAREQAPPPPLAPKQAEPPRPSWPAHAAPPHPTAVGKRMITKLRAVEHRVIPQRGDVFELRPAHRPYNRTARQCETAPSARARRSKSAHRARSNDAEPHDPPKFTSRLDEVAEFLASTIDAASSLRWAQRGRSLGNERQNKQLVGPHDHWMAFHLGPDDGLRRYLHLFAASPHRDNVGLG